MGLATGRPVLMGGLPAEQSKKTVVPVWVTLLIWAIIGAAITEAVHYAFGDVVLVFGLVVFAVLLWYVAVSLKDIGRKNKLEIEKLELDIWLRRWQVKQAYAVAQSQEPKPSWLRPHTFGDI
jgi:uncharacterized membrane protein